MWSNNKYINISMNILLFMLAINFAHLGQFVLPIMCLLMFIDNRFKFKVNNIAVFITLCLFSISFFIFSVKNFYCVMGFTLPMAYYIGSNLKEVNENNIKMIIYIIVAGMLVHLCLNFVEDFSRFGVGLFTSHDHYDFWIKDDQVVATITAVNYVIPIGCLYYITRYEKNKKIKMSYYVLMIIVMVYDISLGRRTPVLLVFVSLLFSILYDFIFVTKRLNISRDLIVKIIYIAFAIVFIACIVLMAIGTEKIKELTIVNKFLWMGLDADRLYILIDAFKLAPEHLWGGNEISEILEIHLHDIWSDTFDIGGIVTYFLFIVYSISYLLAMIKVSINKKMNKEYKTLFIPLFICITLQMALEPVMSSSTIFLLSAIIIETCLEKYVRIL